MNWGNRAIERALSLAFPTNVVNGDNKIGEGYITINQTGVSAEKIKINFTLDIPNKVIYLSTPVMLPVKPNTTVNFLNIEEFRTSNAGYIEIYRVFLEGDEIKEFPNGGALIVESLRINFNFE